MKTNENATADSAAQANGMANPNNLERTREILFGPNLREIEKRFTRIEERLTREVGEAREEFRRRLEQVETHFKSEIEILNGHVGTEREERSRQLKQANNERAAADSSLEEKLSQLVESTGRTTRDLSNQTREQHRLLAEELQHKFDTLTSNLAREAATLREDKTDRAALADMLGEIAMRLRGDVPSLPDHQEGG
jgi:hypothetical protein